uniref:Integrase catalytic domain-containing protein n=1 Tax=Esox lucius TaxID=8010 RepID=A0AAY5KAM6_ESOLU
MMLSCCRRRASWRRWWELDADIARAQRDEPFPPACPEGHTYVPASVRDRLIYWAHTSPSSSHPDIGPMLRALAGPYHHPGRCGSVLEVLAPLASALPTALQTAEALFTHVFRHYGVPEDIVSDRGPQFTSRVWKAFMQHLGVSVSLTTGSNPQSNGQVERVNQEVGRFLRSYCQDRPGEWAEFLPWAEYALNSLHHSSTGMSPFQCVLGYQPVLAPWTPSQTGTPAVDDWFRRAAGTWEAVQARLRLALRHQKTFADRHLREAPVYHPGDWVWHSTKDLPLCLPCRKLGPRFVGPFKVLRRVNEVTYRLRLPPNYRINPSFHVSLLRQGGGWSPSGV